MSLFVNQSSLHNHYLDCDTVDVGEIIERDCLSVLHKLHDQVNGLQLVQVVVQPLAKLFNPASLAALAATSSQSHNGAPPNASAAQTELDATSTNTYMMSPDTAQALIARLDTDRDVNWLMEIIGYGLSMPFSLISEQDSVKDCCTIYCEWFAASLLPYDGQNEDNKYQQLSKLVPVPIKREPNKYARKMLSHLYNVFLPRQPMASLGDANLAAVSRQAVLCHRVLRTIESVSQNPSNLMDNQTWDHLLALIVTVSDKLLSPPTEPDDIGTQLHDRILGVLFDLMTLASSKNIPTQSLWKTFHKLCLNWRHRPALIDHWRRITLLLTKRIVTKPSRARNSNSDISNMANEFQRTNSLSDQSLSAIELAVNGMSSDNLSHAWYRFLHLIGNPVELSDPSVISRTEEFYRSACTSDNVLDPRQHPCLNILPSVFMNSMSGLRDLIDTFLGQYTASEPVDNPQPHPASSARGSVVSLSNVPASPTSPQYFASNPPQPPQAMTPTQSRRPLKPLALKNKVIPFQLGSSSSTNTTISPVIEQEPTVTKTGLGGLLSRHQQQPQFKQPRPSITSITSRTSQSTVVQTQFKLSPDRPKINSILHVFGDWLFSAALLGSDLNNEYADPNNDASLSDGNRSVCSTSTTTETSGLRSISPSLSRRRNSAQQKSTSSGRTSQTSTSKQADSERIMLDPPLSPESFESGQAEAMSVLCRIFASKTATEDISPSYLSRFYLCIQHCLACGDSNDPITMKRLLLTSALVNSTDLLQKDLDGINLLIPSIIRAIEYILEGSENRSVIQPPPRQYHNRSGSIRQLNQQPVALSSNNELRRSCIIMLLNLLPFPLHFKDLVIRNCLNDTAPTTTFGSLRPRLLKLLFMALQTESDPCNMQMLFGGLSSAIHDLTSQSGKLTRDINTRGSRRGRYDSQSEVASTTTDPTNIAEDAMNQNSFVFDTNSGFLIKSLHVTCHLLTTKWKNDTQVSLAALGLLSTISRITSSPDVMNEFDESARAAKSLRQNNNNNNDYITTNNNNRLEMRHEYRQTTRWICDYICNQCSRPPPAHSRDMHSTIVAAYQCLSVWICNHPYLLEDAECVNTLMEVIELGVSGQKSKSSNETSIARADKAMKPSSMRVREAAESLLNICMVRSNTSIDKAIAACDSVLDEPALADLFGGNAYKTSLRQTQDPDARRLEAYKLFKYFTDDDSIIFGLLEGHSQDPAMRDSVICLLRTPFGRHCWRMRINYHSESMREKIIANKTLGLIRRPFQSTTPTSDGSRGMFVFGHPPTHKSLYFNQQARFFPDSIESIPTNDLDHSVSTVDDYIAQVSDRDSRARSDLDKISKMLNHQLSAERKVVSECSIQLRRTECEEPMPAGDLEAARMIFTHLGLRTCMSALVAGDRVSTSYVHELRSLDHQPPRNCDLVNVFYVRKNLTSAKDIVESTRERLNVTLGFYEWLLELGQPTLVKNHCRWTGKPHSSWDNRPATHSTSNQQSVMLRNQMLTSDHGGAIFDGDRMTLYWSDMCQELAFIVPHRIESCAHATPGDQHAQDPNYDRQSICSVASDVSNQSNRAPSQQSSPHSNKDSRDTASVSRTSVSAHKRKLAHSDMNIIICWLECVDDMDYVPSDALLHVSETGFLIDDGGSGSYRQPKNKDYVKYFISPLRNGLHRINVSTSLGRPWFALPIVDGMIVSKCILSKLIRESVMNLCRRRRLDADSYQPPHVRRRFKIQELSQNHKVSCRLESTEYYNNIFRTKCN